MKAWPWFTASVVFGCLAFLTASFRDNEPVSTGVAIVPAEIDGQEKTNKTLEGNSTTTPSKSQESSPEKTSSGPLLELVPATGPTWFKTFKLHPSRDAFIDTGFGVSDTDKLDIRSPDGPFEIAWGEYVFEAQYVEYEKPNTAYQADICPGGASVTVTSCRECPHKDSNGLLTVFGPLKTYPSGVPDGTIVKVRNRGNRTLRLWVNHAGDPNYFRRDVTCD